MATLTGKLLVAVPTLLDPNFYRSVVYVLEHGDAGAMGVVLDRPTDIDLADSVPEWAELAAEPAVAYVGGPVEQDALLAFTRVRAVTAADGWSPLIGRVGTVDLARAPHDVRPDVEVVRVFVGYAGWGAYQLERELDRRDWYVVPAEPDDLLTRAPSTLWRRVLRRQGGDVALAAHFPVRLSSN